MNKLEQFQSMTQGVADTGDLAAMIPYQPQDATTNPSLLLKAADLPRYQPLLDETQRWGRRQDASPASRAAAACADGGVNLISPFVGRILDWHLAASVQRSIPPEQDPGVLSVSRTYDYDKQHGDKTAVTGASFSDVSEIERLAGCDRLTISPQLMQELAAEEFRLSRRLDPEQRGENIEKSCLSEKSFCWSMNEDAMATEKLAEGIRLFTRDQERFESRLVA